MEAQTSGVKLDRDPVCGTRPDAAGTLPEWYCPRVVEIRGEFTGGGPISLLNETQTSDGRAGTAS